MPQNDADLLQQFSETGDQRAFAEITQRHVNALYSVALRRVCGDEHLARDVVQDVFISLAQHAESLGTHPCLIGWLYSATRNAAANRIRTEVRRRNREQKAHAMDNLHPDAQQNIAWAQLAPFLEESIDLLGQTDRHALLLRFFEQRSFAELGKALSISEDGARMRVDRALEKLRQLLARRGIRSTAAVLGATLITNAVGAAPAGLATKATGAALQNIPTFWDHLANLMRAFRPVEKALLLACGLAIAGAWLAPQFIKPADTANSSSKDKDLVSLQLELQALRESAERQLQTLRQIEHAAPARKNAVASPDSGAVLAGGRRAALSANYHAFYQSHGFTAAQIDQFETLQLLAPATSILWIYDQPAVPGDAPPLPPAEVESRLQTLLGEEAFRHYQQYNRLLPARAAACQVASAVYMTEPLDRAKSDQLVELLGRSSPGYHEGGKVDLATLDWENALAAASKILSPAQCNALAAIRHETVFQQALTDRVNQLSAIERRPAQP